MLNAQTTNNFATKTSTPVNLAVGNFIAKKLATRKFRRTEICHLEMLLTKYCYNEVSPRRNFDKRKECILCWILNGKSYCAKCLPSKNFALRNIAWAENMRENKKMYNIYGTLYKIYGYCNAQIISVYLSVTNMYY